MKAKSLKDYEGEYPAEMIYRDMKQEKIKKMTVPEKAWRAAAEKQENTDVNREIIFRYLATRKDVQTEQYFNES